MLVDAMKRLAERLDESVEEHEVGDPFFRNPSYKPFPISKEKFRHIESIQSDRRLAFIDGENQEILGNPKFFRSIQSCMLLHFAQQQRVFEDKLPSPVEFLSLTHSTFKDSEIIYDTQLIPLEDNYKEFLPKENFFTFGIVIT